MSNRLLLLRRLSPPARWQHNLPRANRSGSGLLFHRQPRVITEGEAPPVSRPASSNHPFSSSASLSLPPTGGPGAASAAGLLASRRQRHRAASTALVAAASASSRPRTGAVVAARRLLGHKARVGAQAVELQDRIREEGHEEAMPRREKKRAAKGGKKKKHKKYEGGHDDEYDDDSRGAAAPAARSERSLADEYSEFARGFDDEEGADDAMAGADADAGGPTLPDVDRMRARMMKVVSHLERSFRSIRGDEPTPEMFESISVVAYGTPGTPLTSVAQVVIASPSLARLTCYDPENATAVSDAVRDAGLNLNPRVEEGGEVMVPIPKVSAETRRALSKQIGKMAEASRVRVRSVRKKAHDACRRGRDGKLEGISKDDAFRVEKEVDAATEEVIRVINDVVEKKQESLMSV